MASTCKKHICRLLLECCGVLLTLACILLIIAVPRLRTSGVLQILSSPAGKYFLPLPEGEFISSNRLSEVEVRVPSAGRRRVEFSFIGSSNSVSLNGQPKARISLSKVSKEAVRGFFPFSALQLYARISGEAARAAQVVLAADKPGTDPVSYARNLAGISAGCRKTPVRKYKKLVVTKPGAKLRRIKADTVVITANNVEITDSIIGGAKGTALAIAENISGTVLRRVTIDGGGISSMGVRGRAFMLSSVEIRHVTKTAVEGGSIVSVTGSWFHDIGSAGKGYGLKLLADASLILAGSRLDLPAAPLLIDGTSSKGRLTLLSNFLNSKALAKCGAGAVDIRYNVADFSGLTPALGNCSAETLHWENNYREHDNQEIPFDTALGKEEALPSETPAPTVTPMPFSTRAATPSVTPFAVSTKPAIPAPSNTATRTATSTATKTASSTPTRTATFTPTRAATFTPTLVPTPTVCAVQVEERIITNGLLKVGVKRSYGGAIHWLSVGEGGNLVNIHDLGRFIQQSYYAGNSVTAPNQHPVYAPFAWNPIQAGDVYNHISEVRDLGNSGKNIIYVRAVPKLWDRNNQPAQAVLETYIKFHSTIKEVLIVDNKITIDRNYNDEWGPEIFNGQEMPALYFTTFLDKVLSYTGSNPGTGAALSEIKLDSRNYFPATERWAAAVNSASNGGIGVYSPDANIDWLAVRIGAAGVSNPLANETTYLTPVGYYKLPIKGTFQYRYYLMAGHIDTIRWIANHLKSEPD